MSAQGARCAILACALVVAAVARPRAIAQVPPAPLFHGGDAPVTVGPAPPGTRGTEVDACAGCHAEIAREWRGSLHRAAWHDPVFQSAYAIEPQAFCRNCHAPRMAPGAPAPDALAAREGVSCAVCHVREGAVLGSGDGRGDSHTPGAPVPHPVRAEPRIAQSAFCAGCHQFDFPPLPGVGTAGGTLVREPMQDTFREYLASAAAVSNTRCQDCHMPWRTLPDGRRYRSHAFAGARDPALLARAVRVEASAQRDGPAGVLVTFVLTGDQIGHAFPTGDLFRQAELRAWVEPAAGPGREARALLTRSYAPQRVRGDDGRTHGLRHQTADSRVPPPGRDGAPARRVVDLRLSAPPGARILWTLDHLLMPADHAAARGLADARNRARVRDGSLLAP